MLEKFKIQHKTPCNSGTKEKSFNIVLRVDESYKKDPKAMGDLLVDTPRGIKVPLRELADILEGSVSGGLQVGFETGVFGIDINAGSTGYELSGGEVSEVTTQGYGGGIPGLTLGISREAEGHAPTGTYVYSGALYGQSRPLYPVDYFDYLQVPYTPYTDVAGFSIGEDNDIVFSVGIKVILGIEVGFNLSEIVDFFESLFREKDCK